MEPLSADLVASFRSVSTATLSFQLLKRGYRDLVVRGVRTTRPDIRLVGRARTLRYVPTRADIEQLEYDNRTNYQRLAIESIEPGEVLVVDARGDISAATLGHILATRLKKRGGSGIVTDGAIRDAPHFTSLELPVYCAASNPNTSLIAHHPASIDEPISCGGVLVLPGDVIVGDPEGVLIVPWAVAHEIADAAVQQDRLEEFVLSRIEAGFPLQDTYPPSEEILREYEIWTKDGQVDP